MLFIIIVAFAPLALLGVEIWCGIQEARQMRELSEKMANETYAYIDGRIHYQ